VKGSQVLKQQELPGQTNCFHLVAKLQQQQSAPLCHTTNGSSSSNSTLTAFSSIG